MPFAAPPAIAAWQHQEARSGFEVVTFQPLDDGWQIDGTTTAVEDGQPWAVGYRITVDTTWTTRAARVTGRSASGARSTVLEQRAQRLPQVADQLSFAVAARSLVDRPEGLLAITADDIFS